MLTHALKQMFHSFFWKNFRNFSEYDHYKRMFISTIFKFLIHSRGWAIAALGRFRSFSLFSQARGCRISRTRCSRSRGLASSAPWTGSLDDGTHFIHHQFVKITENSNHQKFSFRQLVLGCKRTKFRKRTFSEGQVFQYVFALCIFFYSHLQNFANRW